MQRAIELFNNREFFECHEVLEEEWTTAEGPRRLFLQSLIHVAVGLYHWQRRNPLGAARQLRKALSKLQPYLPSYEAIDTAQLYKDSTRALEQIESAATQLDLPRILHQPPNA